MNKKVSNCTLYIVLYEILKLVLGKTLRRIKDLTHNTQKKYLKVRCTHTHTQRILKGIYTQTLKKLIIRKNNSFSKMEFKNEQIFHQCEMVTNVGRMPNY